MDLLCLFKHPSGVDMAFMVNVFLSPFLTAFIVMCDALERKTHVITPKRLCSDLTNGIISVKCDG